MACHSIVAVTQTDQDHLFTSWMAFTTSLQQDTYLHDVPSDMHLDLLIIFTCHYLWGLLSHSSQPIGAQCMEEALHAMGQVFAQLGLLDP